MKIIISVVIAIMIIVVVLYVLTTGLNQYKSDRIIVDSLNYKQVIGDLIKSGKTPDICEKVERDLVYWSFPELMPKDICYQDFAIARKDPNICNNVFNKEACLNVVNATKSRDEIVDWQTYKDEEYGFEMDYPKYWSFVSGLNEVTGRNEIQFKQGDMSEFKIEIGKYGTNQTGYFTIEKIINMEQEWVDDFATMPQREDILFNNYKAVKFSYTNENIKPPIIRTVIYFEKNKEVYKISYESFSSQKETYYPIFDQMLFTFKFIEAEEPYIKVLFPNGGEKLLNGQTHDITWESQGIDKVFITVIDYNVEETCRLTYDVENYVSAEKGKYSWTVGSGRCSVSPGDKFKIEIQEPEGTSPLRAKDTSDNYFIIEK